MAKIKTYKQRYKGGKGKFKYFVNDKSFDDEKEARSYYKHLKAPTSLDVGKEIGEIDKQLIEIEKRTDDSESGVISSFDVDLKKKLIEQKGAAYHSAGVDTTGWSQPQDDLSASAGGLDWVKKVASGVGKFFKGLTISNEGQKLADRIKELSIEYRQLRAQGKLPPEIKPNEINAYARSQAKAELEAYKKNTDPLGIIK